MDPTIVLDNNSSADVLIDLDSTFVSTSANEPEFPEESIEQLLLRSTAVLEAASSIMQKPAPVQRVTVRELTSMPPPISLPIPPPNGNSRNLNESDDDVIFVGEQNTVINLCSPDCSPRSSSILFHGNHGAKKGSATQTTATSVPVEKTLEKDKENNVNCAVCMESSVGRQPHSTICGHIFCGACIKEAIKIRRKCPLCNKTLTLKNIFPIFI